MYNKRANTILDDFGLSDEFGSAKMLKKEFPKRQRKGKYHSSSKKKRKMLLFQDEQNKEKREQREEEGNKESYKIQPQEDLINNSEKVKKEEQEDQKPSKKLEEEDENIEENKAIKEQQDIEGEKNIYEDKNNELKKEIKKITKKFLKGALDKNKKKELECWQENKIKEGNKKNEILGKIKAQNESIRENNDQIETSLQVINFRYIKEFSTIWIFLFDEQNLSTQVKTTISRMNNGEIKNNLFPICTTREEVIALFNIQNALLKMVTDVQNMKLIEEYHDYSPIVEFHIYNEKQQAGMKEALNIKRKYWKVRSLTNNITKILERAQDEIQCQVQLIEERKNLIQTNHKKKRFPSFLQLSGKDKSDAVNYRVNLYGAISIPEEERVQKYMDFMSFVSEKYPKQKFQDQYKNIKNYSKLTHLNNDFCEQRCRKILNFYTQQTFYYCTLNKILRTMKTSEEFKYCALPFNENYNAVKYFYDKHLQSNNRKIKEKILYRGVKNMKQKDLQVLMSANTKNQLFIEIYGFISTSEIRKNALQFMQEQKGILFVIKIPEMVIPQQYTKYDHGFVVMNEFNISAIPEEKEVLFNPLNIFKFLKSEIRMEEGKKYTEYHLEYGVIFDLLAKKQNFTLTPTEEEILMNYKYCNELQEEINNQGDVYMITNDLQQSKKYYKRKYEEYEKKNDQDGLGNACLKLAVTHHNLGELKEARYKAQEAIKIKEENLDKEDKQKCLKVYSIHSKNAQISYENEDYLHADQEISKEIKKIQELKENKKDQIELGKKFRFKGQIQFKKGEIQKAESSYAESEKIFEGILQSAYKKKLQIRRELVKKYLYSFITFSCREFETHQKWKEQEDNRIRQIQVQIQSLQADVREELLKVVNSLKQVAVYVEDKIKYEKCVHKARSYLALMQIQASADPYQKAKLKVIEATVNSYYDLYQSQKLIQQAINIVEEMDPDNPDVGKYCQKLAKIQKNYLQISVNPKAAVQVDQLDDEEREKKPRKRPEKLYNHEQQKKTYKKCIKNYEKAIYILLQNKKTEQSPEVLRIKNEMVEVQFNFENFSTCESIIAEIRKNRESNPHSQIAKATFVLAKIAYSRGQISLSFHITEEAKQILEKTLVKVEEESEKRSQQLKIYKKSNIYIQVTLYQCKLYTKQLKHSLALKKIDGVEKFFKTKENFSQLALNSFRSEIYRLKGQLKASLKLHDSKNNLLKQKKDYHYYFQEAITRVERQRGANNILNASIYFSYIHSLTDLGDLKQAEKILNKLAEISVTLPINHPFLWQVYFCFAIYKQKKEQNEDSLDLMKMCLRVMKYDETHISKSKVILKYLKILKKENKEDDKGYANGFQRKLEKQMDDSLQRYQDRGIKQEYDDEKKQILENLSQIQRCKQFQRHETMHQLM